MSQAIPTITSSTPCGTAKTLWHLLAARVRGNSHKERLESFYSGQATGYDEFRHRLLHGRRELIQSLPLTRGAVWVDLGAGTGANAEFLGERIHQLGHVYQVDLCAPLLEIATQRAATHNWRNVLPIEADATRFHPPELADVVTFSYSLTMIPDWFAAIEAAVRMLKPGGVIGVVDFYVSRKFPEAGHARHSWARRTFWSLWFAADNVMLSGDHLAFLERHFETVRLEEHLGKVPFLPLIKTPYYLFIGQKGLRS